MTKRNGLMATGVAGLALSAGLVLGPRLVTESERPQGAEEQQEHGHRRRPLPSESEIAALPPDGGSDWNRLVFEKSPYLLQHAGNPVDWFPWGEEAFAKAAAEDKPVFLSVGYSTCHWCHVMEEESFEDPEVAELLNEHFVAIKVDREERPDVDQLYMTITQAMTGSGGWPMTVVMTPDRRPFFAGTYFPKRGRFGRQGMMELLPALADAWKKDRENVLATAGRVVDFLGSRQGASAKAEAPGREVLDAAYTSLARSYDRLNGGFGSAPKFPVPHNLRFLLRYWHRTGEERALTMVVETLEAMRRGGSWDHVGFGFHRYSTDAEWLLPHFEKMLYDQALLATAAIEAWQATGNEGLRRTAEEILAYVLRDMTSPQGGFYSAEDADSEGEEGLFYLWTPEELREVLGTEDGNLAIRIFGVVREGNFRDQSTRQTTGKSILHLRNPVSTTASDLGIRPVELVDRLESIRARLFAVREKRIHPLKDDKVLTDWNGLTIAAMAMAARAFGEPRYEEAARRAADFVLTELRDGDGKLLKRWRSGEAAHDAVLDDYAFLVLGLLELYEANFDVRYLRAALELTETMVVHFHDEERGGFFLSPSGRSDLLVRPQEFYDGAIPSGNSIAALDLLRLARITGDPRWEELASGALAAASGAIRSAPHAHTQHLIALDFALGPTFEVVIAGDLGSDDTGTMLSALRRPFLPNKVVMLRPSGDSPAIASVAEYVGGFRSLDGKATAYVCQNFQCQLPTTSIAKMTASFEVSSGDGE
jgi:hypothetical protein